MQRPLWNSNGPIIVQGSDQSVTLLEWIVLAIVAIIASAIVGVAMLSNSEEPADEVVDDSEAGADGSDDVGLKVVLDDGEEADDTEVQPRPKLELVVNG